MKTSIFSEKSNCLCF